MKPPDEEIRRLIGQWLEKAELDFDALVFLLPQDRFRSLVAFHAQQAVEKYLKALIARHQIEIPKTHELRRLLELLTPAEPELAAALEETKWLEPFSVEIRYPGDAPDTLPGQAQRAHDLARRTRDAVMAILNRHLSRT